MESASERVSLASSSVRGPSWEREDWVFSRFASGRVSRATALALAIPLGALALWEATWLGQSVVVCVSLYLLLNLSYTWWLKGAPLIEVIVLALGFLLRLVAGIYPLGDIPTVWITLCMFFLALFLGFSKRRCELANAGERARLQRPVLARYTLPYLDTLVSGAAAITVVCYALFTGISGKNATLVITVPLVYGAIMYYKHLVMVRSVGEEPEGVLLHDRIIQVTVASWLLIYLVVEHNDPGWFRAP